jgi:hypothetical protein
VQGNRIADLPATITGLTTLRELHLRANALRALPNALADAPKLEKLDLRWNAFPALPPVAKRLVDRGCFVLW